MKKAYKHIATSEQRMTLKSMLDKNISIADIAEHFNKNQSSIYREIKRGNDGSGYNPEYSQLKYETALRAKGKESVFTTNPELAQFVADCILVEHISPEKIVDKISENERFKGLTISKTTIYNSIYNGLIPGVTKKELQNITAKMFSDGHIIIPKWIREKYDFKDNDTFEISVSDDGHITMIKQM